MKSIYVIVQVLMVFVASAHEDTRLEFTDNSVISGLPKQYSPAHFDLKKGVLSIGDSKLKLTDHMMSLFPNSVDDVSGNRTVPDAGKTELKLSGSWYHDKELLPEYLSIRWRERGKTYWFSILVDLSSLSVLDVEIILDGRHLSLSLFPDKETNEAEQDGADQPATAPESRPQGEQKTQPESEPAPR